MLTPQQQRLLAVQRRILAPQAGAAGGANPIAGALRAQLLSSVIGGGRRGGGGGGMSVGYGPTAGGGRGSNYTINAHARPAATGDDVIKMQGGLAPSYGPSGINDTYDRRANMAHDRLQDSYKRAKAGDTEGADDLEKAQQAQGMGFGDVAQRVRANVRARDTFGRAPGGMNPDGSAPPAQGVGGEDLMGTPQEEIDTPIPEGPSDQTLPDGDQSDQYSDAYGNYSEGGEPTDDATAGEVGPETKFNDDGSIQEINQPVLMHHPKPGVIVPNPRLQKFLNKFRHPSKDVSFIKNGRLTGMEKAPAFDMGGGISPMNRVDPMFTHSDVHDPYTGEQIQAPGPYTAQEVTAVENAGREQAAYDKGGELPSLASETYAEQQQEHEPPHPMPALPSLTDQTYRGQAFRKEHGSDFDPNSSMDRRKMQRLMSAMKGISAYANR